ncbi:MAG: HAMP domain-containing histidine kinase [Bacteroidetes bacterium]|nr:HAMP domain-containing histidine kinase [Bacteroidota bacterium]MCB0843888.1 HAMP domain-containing histidine kinase [Bacteroidota bacterium]
MTKLLEKPLKAFALYSLLILMISIPAYFLVIDHIWLNELDEHNQIVRDRIVQRFENNPVTSEELALILKTWNNLQTDTKIQPINHSQITTDSIYEVEKGRYDKNDGWEEDRFRGLQSYFEINGLPYRIMVETNVEEADETLLAIALVTSVFFILLILGFILLNKKIAQNTWKPFNNTLKALKSFDLTKEKPIEFEETDIFEFHELNQSLQSLIKHSISTYQQQKSFTENASHELQTPIALLKSKFDLLFQEEDLTPKMSKLLNSIEIPLSRLSRINKNLLLLAKVENHQYKEVEDLKIDHYLKNTLTLFEDYLAEENLMIHSSDDQLETIKANPFLLETFLGNLLSNAIRHTPADGKIVIHIKSNLLVFSNSGIKPLDSEKIFRRFSTTSKEVVGSGLGLAIIKEIATRYGWNIYYDHHDDMHSFSVSF